MISAFCYPPSTPLYAGDIVVLREVGGKDLLEAVGGGGHGHLAMVCIRVDELEQPRMRTQLPCHMYMRRTHYAGGTRDEPRCGYTLEHAPTARSWRQRARYVRMKFAREGVAGITIPFQGVGWCVYWSLETRR